MIYGSKSVKKTLTNIVAQTCFNKLYNALYVKSINNAILLKT